MDRYTKFILTIIAVGILGVNFHLFKDAIVTPAHAENIQYMIICDTEGQCADVTNSGRFKVHINDPS